MRIFSIKGLPNERKYSTNSKLLFYIFLSIDDVNALKVVL